VRGHIDPGILADYREGLLSRRRAARVAAHLSGCPRCAETDAQLAGVTTILASSPVPPMPAGLAGRIEAALAAEAASRAAGEASHAAAAGAAHGEAHSPPANGLAGVGRGDAGGGHARQQGPSRARPPRRSWLTPRVAAVAAAVAVIAGGGYGVAQLLSQSTNTGAGSSTAARPPAEHGLAGSGSGTGGAASRMAPSATTIGNLRVVSTGTHYQQQQLASQAKEVLGRYGQQQPGPKNGGNSHLPGSFGATFASLPACVQRVSGGHTPKLVDLASFGGQQAAVIMLPAAQHQVRVVVVGPGCSGAASDVLARALVPAAG
jgi:putative zinc finger protein